MQKTYVISKEILTIGLMLFALFFGAGNMIFPPLLGQEAGTNFWNSILGFLITGVGLPLLGVMAIAKAGSLETLANRVHPVYGAIFTFVSYLAIGPLFGIPRTGSVAYEMGFTPLLPKEMTSSAIPLMLYTIIYFLVTAWLAMNPSKLVSRIGKILTPALLIIIAVLAIKSFMTPMGPPGKATESYAINPFFKGFMEGYLTLDAIAALVFGIVVIGAIQDKGVHNKAVVAKVCMYAGFVAAVGLTLVYIALAYIGATAQSSIGVQENGAAILSGATNVLFGSSGTFILGLAITFACLTTSVGLVSSCAQYFVKLNNHFSYKSYVIFFSLLGTVIANIGLSQLISISVPILVFIYPLAIVLVLLSFLHNLFDQSSYVYIFALIPTGFLSLIEGLKTAGVDVSMFHQLFSRLPLYSEGIGWVIPAIAGAIIGFTITIVLRGPNKTTHT